MTFSTATETVPPPASAAATTNIPVVATDTEEHDFKIPDRHFKDWPNECGFNAQVEVRTPRTLEVTGKFPSYVSGSLLRIGPGSYKWERENPEDGYVECSHWFDGYSHVHKFDIIPGENGSPMVKYMSRRQADEILIEARRTGQFKDFSFAQKRDPCDSFFRKVKTAFKGLHRNLNATTPNNRDVGVAFVPSVHSTTTGTPRVSAVSDHSGIKEFDMETLEPYGITEQSHLHPSLTGPLSSAHPAVDPDTHDVFNYNLDLGRKATYRIFRVDAATHDTEILATVAEPDVKAAYLHSLSLTPSFVVLCVWPAHLAAGGAAMLWNRNVLDSIAAWDPAQRAVWVVVDRRHGRGVVAKFTSDARFCFHTVNAWETPSPDGASLDLFCDVVQYASTDIIKRFYYENLTSTAPHVRKWAAGARGDLDPVYARYKLGGVPAGAEKKELVRGTAEVVKEIRAPAAAELPSMNPEMALRPHRFVYGVADRGMASWIDSLVKTDLETGEAVFWCTPKHSPSEAIFVADPEGKHEDDGVLLSVVLDGVRKTSYLLCLDAKTFTEVARADVGVAVGLGFHGIHVKA